LWYLSFLEPLYVNVTKQVFVHSILECAHLCRAEETCEAFKHRNVHDDVNCQITEGEPEVSTLQENDGKEKKWTLYTLETIESVRNYQIGLATNEEMTLLNTQEEQFLTDIAIRYK
jgi:hypothetical protein